MNPIPLQLSSSPFLAAKGPASRPQAPSSAALFRPRAAPEPPGPPVDAPPPLDVIDA